MAKRTLSVVTDDRFVDEVDQAVLKCQTAHPFAKYTRSTFMKSAIQRAVAEINLQYGRQPKARTRERTGAAA